MHASGRFAKFVVFDRPVCATHCFTPAICIVKFGFVFRCLQARTTRNAQKIFRHSLWYLPVVLSLMVYHSKNWDRDRSAVHDVNVREINILIVIVVHLPAFCL